MGWSLSSNQFVTLQTTIFSGLRSLDELNLAGNRLTTLLADVFSHLSRPLELTLFDFRIIGEQDNIFVCDAALCWLKQEEHLGSITWGSVHIGYELYFFKPICSDGRGWDNWICNETGGFATFNLSIMTFCYQVYRGY